MKSAVLIFSLILSFSTILIGGTKVRLVHAPTEVASGDDFILLVSAAPREKGNNRCLVVQLPHTFKIVKAYAVTLSKFEREDLDENKEVTDLFTADKNHSVFAFTDAAKAIEKEATGVIYYIIIHPPTQTMTAEVKCCLVERNDPYYTVPPPLPKEKKPKKAKPRSYEWRMVNPGKGLELSFGSGYTQSMSRSIRIVSGWSNTSRALDIGSKSKVLFTAPKQSIDSFFRKPFSIRWWLRSANTEQNVFTLHTAGSSKHIRIGIDEVGLPFVSLKKANEEELIPLQPDKIAIDGAWHHHLLSRDSVGVLRYYFDGELSDSSDKEPDMFDGVDSISIARGESDQFQLDELQFSRIGYVKPADFLPNVGIALRDTVSSLFALFHFEEYGQTARSSIPIILMTNDSMGVHKQVSIPKIEFDSLSRIHETSSPILLDNAPLSVEQTSLSRISFSWKATRENNVKSYELQRRIASFGEYQKVIRLDAKRPLKINDEEADFISRANYSAIENLPALGQNIDLYYRLALIGFDSSKSYTEPIKIEYGKQKDVFVEQNKPNPFNNKTTISFRLAHSGFFKLTVYDIIGREVVVLVDKKLEQGRHTAEIDGTTWLSGIYFYKARMGKTIVTKRMVLAK